MKKNHILILDYSVDRSETPIIKSCLSNELKCTSLFIDTEDSFPDNLIDEEYSHIIHSGSALSINETSPFTQKAIKYINKASENGVWQMGICYGHQLLCKAIIGSQAVRSSPKGFEVGWCEVSFNDKAKELMDLRSTEIIWQHHFDEVIKLPIGSDPLATSAHCQNQSYINFELKLFGTQFHPEYEKESGNRHFMRDRELLESHNYKVDDIIKNGPSLDAGKVFFEFFLNQD